MSFQLTFLGYYPIKSQQLKKQTHSVKRRNWKHRERTAQADGPRWMAEADGFRQKGQPSAFVGWPWKTAPASEGGPLLSAVGGRSAPLFAGCGGRRMANGLADGCQSGCP
jgi:hypothetical protein